METDGNDRPPFGNGDGVTTVGIGSGFDFRTYLLNGRETMKCGFEEFTKNAKYGSPEWRVGQDIINGVTVSTVFLGTNHAFGQGPPLLFETMSFAGNNARGMGRCSTYDEAEQMHKDACEVIRKLYAENPQIEDKSK